MTSAADLCRILLTDRQAHEPGREDTQRYPQNPGHTELGLLTCPCCGHGHVQLFHHDGHATCLGCWPDHPANLTWHDDGELVGHGWHHPPDRAPRGI